MRGTECGLSPFRSQNATAISQQKNSRLSVLRELFTQARTAGLCQRWLHAELYHHVRVIGSQLWSSCRVNVFTAVIAFGEYTHVVVL
jgi:hypothetical protein